MLFCAYLAELTGQAAYTERARAALAGARSSRRRGTPGTGTVGAFTGRASYVYGIASVALGRALSLPDADDATARAEIAAGMRALEERDDVCQLCLCHGTLGNADMLLLMSQTLDDRRGSAAAARLGDVALSRLAAPQRVPSVLGLQPPYLAPR